MSEPIELQELGERLDSEFDYPVELATVRERLGDVEVVTPGEGDSRTVAGILDAVPDGPYESADSLFGAILGSLPDEYVGRKYYSDRGVTVDEGTDEAGDESV